jgi:hypothetical protein
MPKLYTWEQTPTEVRISVPLTEDFNFKRDVSYTIKNGRQMTLKVGGREIINGTLAGIVDQDMAEFGCNVHEEGGVRGLEVHLEKANSVPWRACFEGEEPDAPAPAAAAPAAKPVASPAPAPLPQPGRSPPFFQARCCFFCCAKNSCIDLRSVMFGTSAREVRRRPVTGLVSAEPCRLANHSSMFGRS